MTQAMTENEVNAKAASEGPAEPTPVVFIVGAGVVGTALATRLLRAGVPVAGVHGRRTDLSDASRALSGVMATTGELPDILSQSEAIIISVRDERIPEVAARLVKEKRLRKGQVLLHTSGSLSSGDVLGAARGKVKGIGTLHPLLSFVNPQLAADGLRGAAFAIEGDAAARALALRLVRAVGGRPMMLDARAMALYHAGAVVASNYVVALADVARALFVAAGVPAAEALPALIPLLTSAVRNIEDVGLPDALTGPVVRGDVGTVEGHMAALATHAPQTTELYRLLGREVLGMVRRKGGLAAGVVKRLEELLGGDAGGAVSAATSRSSRPARKARRG